jgi:ribosomal protein S18 acetylase RimI-like enzyme
MRVRPAVPADYSTFVRLFPELGVDDPILEERRFVRELVPSTLIAEGDTGAGGYAFFQLMDGTAYVRHLITAPEARRRGVGRALMSAIAERARAANCTTWCLNVKPDNVAAIALYESCGLRREHLSRALRINWSAVPVAEDATARTIEREDDARVEQTMGLRRGQLEISRKNGRVLLMLESNAEIVGVASFEPEFPGAFPFRVARPELAWTLLHALRPHARHPFTNVATEGQPEVAAALVAGGATVRLDTVHMSGPLP